MSTITRQVTNEYYATPVTEGAGVLLKRVFGYFETPLFDPFLLFDDFRAYDEKDFILGFPWHPHRGIETITYVLKGDVEHGDSLGNSGTISSGDVQWMTAGSGIIHQEMPKGDGKGVMLGFQLWLNLPASMKMCSPRYQDIKATQIPSHSPKPGVEIKIICGSFDGITGPVNTVNTSPTYLDISLAPDTSFSVPTKMHDKVLCYIFEGEGLFSDHGTAVEDGTMLVFSEGNLIAVRTGGKPLRFLLLSGKMLNEPISWRGPIVMNTDQEIELAFQELDQGIFIKNK